MKVHSKHPANQSKWSHYGFLVNVELAHNNFIIKPRQRISRHINGADTCMLSDYRETNSAYWWWESLSLPILFAIPVYMEVYPSRFI